MGGQDQPGLDAEPALLRPDPVDEVLAGERHRQGTAGPLDHVDRPFGDPPIPAALGEGLVDGSTPSTTVRDRLVVIEPGTFVTPCVVAFPGG